MPKEAFGRDHAFLDRKELLSFEEISRVAGVFVGLGVQHVRITGGEPLVRRDSSGSSRSWREPGARARR